MNLKDKKYIKAGVFDSGVGGLSVLKSLIEAKLFDEIIYYGDTARVPYGVKDKDTIIGFGKDAISFFAPHNIDILILACNTMSAYGIQSMNEISDVPIVGVIEPGVIALENALIDKSKNILILATKATINSQAYEIALHKKGFLNTFGIATSLFVPIVEEGIFEGPILQASFDYYFKDTAFYSAPPSAIILGCTHFPLISKALSAYFGDKSLMIHSGKSMAQYLQNTYFLIPNRELKALSYYASDNVNSLIKVANKWLLMP